MGNEMRQRIIQSAREAIAENAIILDTETTGLDENAEIVEIAMVDARETLEVSMLVRPLGLIPEGATAVHGITNEMVALAERWPRVWPAVRHIIGTRPVLTYNAEYDARLVIQTSRRCELIVPRLQWRCLMNDWMFFHGLDRWQRLDNVCAQIGVPVGGHRALGDAKAAREVLRWLARQEVGNA